MDKINEDENEQFISPERINKKHSSNSPAGVEEDEAFILPAKMKSVTQQFFEEIDAKPAVHPSKMNNPRAFNSPAPF